MRPRSLQGLQGSRLDSLWLSINPVAGGTTYAVYVGIKVSVAELPTTASYGNKRDALLVSC